MCLGDCEPVGVGPGHVPPGSDQTPPADRECRDRRMGRASDGSTCPGHGGRSVAAAWSCTPAMDVLVYCGLTRRGRRAHGRRRTVSSLTTSTVVGRSTAATGSEFGCSAAAIDVVLSSLPNTVGRTLGCSSARRDDGGGARRRDRESWWCADNARRIEQRGTGGLPISAWDGLGWRLGGVGSAVSSLTACR